MGINVKIFNEAVANLAKQGANDRVQQTTYLGLIAHFMASIADSLERLADLSDPHRKLPGSSLSGY